MFQIGPREIGADLALFILQCNPIIFSWLNSPFLDKLVPIISVIFLDLAPSARSLRSLCSLSSLPRLRSLSLSSKIPSKIELVLSRKWNLIRKNNRVRVYPENHLIITTLQSKWSQKSRENLIWVVWMCNWGIFPQMYLPYWDCVLPERKSPWRRA